MTREEQIEQAAKRYVKDIVSPLPTSLTVAFIKGAMWADRHPTTEWIDKAHVWLMENYDKYVKVIGSSIYFAYFELGGDFRKAMEEQQ